MDSSETNKPTNSQRKKLYLQFPEREVEEWELDEGDQKTQTPRDKINKYQGCNLQHDDYSYHCCMVCMKMVKRVNPESAHHKENAFLFL